MNQTNQTTKKTAKKVATPPSPKKAEQWKNYDCRFVGPRIAEARKAGGYDRDQIADLVGLSKTQYGNLERGGSTSMEVIFALVNYFATKHFINPAWIMLQDNSKESFIAGPKSMEEVVDELNNLIKHHGLMVSMVPLVKK